MNYLLGGFIAYTNTSKTWLRSNSFALHIISKFNNIAIKSLSVFSMLKILIEFVLFYLALNYFPKRPPSQYLRSFYVSLLSSGWDKVVP